MAIRWRAAAPLVIIFSLPFAAPAHAAPVDKINECSRVEYRQTHLQECNLQPSPFLLGGGGGPCGLLCHIGGLLGHIL